MNEDRVTCNEPDNWNGADYALGMVDEIVVHNATAHFEMSSESSGYLHICRPGRDVFARVSARPTTRAERRQILARNGDRLRDHLRALLPRGGSIWAIPAWQRPASAVRGWREAHRYASAVLCVDIETDEET